MFIPIPILVPPLGTTNIAVVQGAIWKVVPCEHCRLDYAYLMELDGTGEDYDLLFQDQEGSTQRAQAQAYHNLHEKGQNIVLPVPCPHCGHYQENMSRKLKDDASINSLQIAGVAIAASSLIPLAISIPNIWLLTPALAVAGATLLAYGYVVAFSFDPNASDPNTRIAFGQKHAIWGERLADVLASFPPADEPGTKDAVRRTTP